MAAKRPIVVEGNTPGKPENKRPSTQGTSRKSLFSENQTGTNKSSAKREWSEAETSAIVQFICLFWEEAWKDTWPMTGDREFWDACASAVNQTCNSTRTGASCRTRVTKHLSKQFHSLSEAEEALKIDYLKNSFDFGVELLKSTPRKPVAVPDISSLSPIFKCSPTMDAPPKGSGVGDVVKEFLSCFNSSMSSRLKTQLLQHIFKLTIVESDGLDFFKFVSSDFITSSLSAMKNLFSHKKHNLILDLSKCFEGATPRMPLHQMPYGLLDYNIRFFASYRTQKLGMESHYASWLETMFAQFGHKWLCLHRGPAWQYEIRESEEALQSHESQAEVDIIGSALQESLLNLAEEVSDDSLEAVSESLCSMSVTSSDESVCSSLTTSIEEANVNELFHVPHLWTRVSDSDKQDMELGLVSCQDMEKFHSILPNSTKNVRRNPGMYDPLKSKVNIAGLGVREIQKNIASSGFSRTVDVQMEALKKAQESNPQGRWWIKADGCDVRKGLRESMRGIWAGDEDLGDGSLQAMYNDYKARCALVKGIGSTGRCRSINDDIETLLHDLENDLDFLVSGAEVANEAYNKAQRVGKSSEQKMMELAWSIVGFEELVKKVRSFQVELNAFVQRGGGGGGSDVGVGDGSGDGSGATINLGSLQSNLLSYLKDLFSKKRIAASHLLVFMIADELRNRKPYAIPVRFLPYKSLTDAKTRELEQELEDAMRSTGMTVVGFTTDGEFNSLRTAGNVRPISVIELIKNARNEARRMSANTIISCLVLNRHGNPIRQHQAVPLEDVVWLNTYMSDAQVPFERAILMLRRKLFPFMHNPHPWVEGRPETTSEAAKSVMAIYLYRKKIEDLKNHVDPADFTKNLYQPERDVNGELIHHREDHNHVLKRVISRLREGYIPGIDLQYLRDALHDPSTGLTYEALTGKNKQSVPDCERLISPGVISFLERKGHASGAGVLKLIHNWHKAADGRGLSEAQRSAYCKDLKEWLLADWMPWFKEIPDYSTIDVNRPIKGICGLTQELVIGLVANLESRELRRVEYQERGLPAEHPRASATDDVEGIISLMHEMLGDIFDLKQFIDEQPKILNEFKKRIDPELEFYYWTGAKERYRDFELPSFNQPSGDGIIERLDRVTLSRRGDPGVSVSNRASMPQTGQLTARAKHHRAPVELPPLRIQEEQ